MSGTCLFVLSLKPSFRLSHKLPLRTFVYRLLSYEYANRGRERERDQLFLDTLAYHQRYKKLVSSRGVN